MCCQKTATKSVGTEPDVKDWLSVEVSTRLCGLQSVFYQSVDLASCIPCAV